MLGDHLPQLLGLLEYGPCGAVQLGGVAAHRLGRQVLGQRARLLERSFWQLGHGTPQLRRLRERAVRLVRLGQQRENVSRSSHGRSLM